jgi:zinc protease
MERTLRAAWPVPRQAETAARQTDGAKLEVIDLGKGRTLILQPDASMPYAAVDMAFAGGDALLTPEQEGLGAVVASSLTRGTKTMTATELEAYTSNRAASLSAASSSEAFRIFMDYPARFEGDMLQLFGETLASPSFLEEEIARVKESQIASITAREDTPVGYAFRRLFPFLFGDHVYGYRTSGSKELIPGFTRKDVLDVWAKQAAMPWVLSVCGAFDREAVIAAARALPAPGQPAPAIKAPVWTTRRELTLTMPDRNQAHLMLVFPGVPVDAGDQPALDLLREILAGQSGLLFRDLRDKEGLGYTVTAMQWQAPLTGAVIFYIGTEPDTLNAAREGFARVINGLHKENLAESELVRGKNQMLNDHIRALQTMRARSADAANLAIRGRKLSAEKDLIEAAQKLTAADLAAMARKYLRLENAYTLQVLPK